MLYACKHRVRIVSGALSALSTSVVQILSLCGNLEKQGQRIKHSNSLCIVVVGQVMM